VGGYGGVWGHHTTNHPPPPTHPQHPHQTQHFLFLGCFSQGGSWFCFLGGGGTNGFCFLRGLLFFCGGALGVGWCVLLCCNGFFGCGGFLSFCIVVSSMLVGGGYFWLFFTLFFVSSLVFWGVVLLLLFSFCGGIFWGPRAVCLVCYSFGVGVAGDFYEDFRSFLLFFVVLLLCFLGLVFVYSA